jgi:hypothetical protein
MLLSEYLSDIVRTIDEYSKTELIAHSDISSDIRTPKVGVIKGVITFIDDSKLYFTEYVDSRYKIQKLSYSFQYQNNQNELIFRYDNAAHKPKLTFAEHKHMGDGSIVEADAPEFFEILREIINSFL